MVSPAQLFSCDAYAELLWFNCNEGGRELQSLQRPTSPCAVILAMHRGNIIALFLGCVTVTVPLCIMLIGRIWNWQKAQNRIKHTQEKKQKTKRLLKKSREGPLFGEHCSKICPLYHHLYCICMRHSFLFHWCMAILLIPKHWSLILHAGSKCVHLDE